MKGVLLVFVDVSRHPCQRLREVRRVIAPLITLFLAPVTSSMGVAGFWNLDVLPQVFLANFTLPHLSANCFFSVINLLAPLSVGAARINGDC